MAYNYLGRYDPVEADNAAYWRDPASDQYANGKPSEQTGWGEGEPYVPVSWVSRGVDPQSRTVSGGCRPGYAAYYYNQIHIIPEHMSLGRILSNGKESVEVWNAYIEETRSLNFINGPIEEDVGLSLTPVIPGDEPPPSVTFPPTQSKIYDINIFFKGTPVVDTQYDFVFDTETKSLTITGNRGIIWGYMPQDNWIEGFNWQTDVIRSFDTHEQYIKVRPVPRRTLTYNYKWATPTLSAKALNKMQASMGLDYGVPIWQQARRLTAQTPPLSTTVWVDTSQSEYVAGDSLFLYNSDTDSEAAIIETVNPDNIELTFGVASNYDEKSYCAPMLICKMPRSVQMGLYRKNAADMSLSFTALQSNSIDPGDLPNQYDDGSGPLDLIVDATEMPSNTVSWSVDGKWENVDFSTGIWRTDLAVNFGRTSRPFSKTFQNLDEVWEWKQWLYKMAGQVGVFWMPDYAEEIEILGTVGPLQTFVSITNVDFAAAWLNTPYTTDLEFRFKDGDIQRKSIVSASAISSTEEQVFFAGDFGRTFTMDDIEIVNLLHKVRMGTDRFEFKWERQNLVTLSFGTMEVIE